MLILTDDIHQAKSADAHQCAETTAACIVGHFAVDTLEYQLQLPVQQAITVKLADFGTADADPRTLERRIGFEHFTTLENTPPELLFYGSTVLQGFALDTFAFGLSALHLFTGQVRSCDSLATATKLLVLSH